MGSGVGIAAAFRTKENGLHDPIGKSGPARWPGLEDGNLIDIIRIFP
jgi:hypothetical protein